MVIKSKQFQEEPFDMEKVKSDIIRKYGIAYDDTTLVVMEILTLHADRLSWKEEMWMENHKKEIESIKKNIWELKTRMEQRNRTLTTVMGFAAVIVTVMVMATFILFWRRAGSVEENVDDMRAMISTGAGPALRSDIHLLDSLLQLRFEKRKER